MFPGFSTQHVVDAGRTNSVFKRQTTLTQSILRPNKQHFFGCKLCDSNRFSYSFSQPALRCRIVNISLAVPNEKMLWIHASGIVASVQDPRFLRKRTISQFKSQPRSCQRPSLSSNTAITIGRFRPDPNPAFIQATDDSLGPKSSLKSKTISRQSLSASSPCFGTSLVCGHSTI